MSLSNPRNLCDKNNWFVSLKSGVIKDISITPKQLFKKLTFIVRLIGLATYIKK